MHFSPKRTRAMGASQRDALPDEGVGSAMKGEPSMGMYEAMAEVLFGDDDDAPALYVGAPHLSNLTPAGAAVWLEERGEIWGIAKMRPETVRWLNRHADRERVLWPYVTQGTCWKARWVPRGAA